MARLATVITIATWCDKAGLEKGEFRVEPSHDFPPVPLVFQRNATWRGVTDRDASTPVKKMMANLAVGSTGWHPFLSPPFGRH